MLTFILCYKVEFWTEFARHGNPNSPKTRQLVQWDPVTNDANLITPKCLNLSKDVSFIEWPELDRMRFWDRLYEQYKENLREC